jgi:8-oxo-dGTP diphosphatase
MAKKQYVYDYPRPDVTVDIALFTVSGALQDLRLQVLLIRRLEEPFRGRWALPGGFVRENEDLDDAARRELAEETGVREVEMEQVGTFGAPGRDPRGHVITVLYAGLVAGDRHVLAATGDAGEARWFSLQGGERLPPLAFDHAELVRLSLEHLRHRIGTAPVCFELLPREFTLSELQTLVEAILDRPLDRRNFRRRVLELGFLQPVDGTWRHGAHRPAQLFRFLPEKFADYCSRERALPF